MNKEERLEEEGDCIKYLGNLIKMSLLETTDIGAVYAVHLVLPGKGVHNALMKKASGRNPV